MTVARSTLLLLAAGALAACSETSTAPAARRALAPSSARRTVVSDPGTGHYYQFVSQSPVNWYTANDEANAMSYGTCASAHLATITSAEEDAVVGSLGEGGGGWIGGRNFTASADPAAGWTWVTGEPFTYANWRGGEPNNSNGSSSFRYEDALYVNFGASGALFVDYPAYGSDLDGFIVEFEACTPAEQTQAVVNTISALVTSGDLTASQAAAITTSLNQALASISNGNNTAAKGQLGAAVNKTNAAVHSGKISAAQGKSITDAIGQVIGGL